MNWIKLKRGNDWGCIYFAINPVNAKRGVTVKDGESCQIRWPDGEITDSVIRTEQVTASVSDHGHDYPMRSTMIYVLAVLHGIETLIPIDKVEVPIDWAVARGAK